MACSFNYTYKSKVGLDTYNGQKSLFIKFFSEIFPGPNVLTKGLKSGLNFQVNKDDEPGDSQQDEGEADSDPRHHGDSLPVCFPVIDIHLPGIFGDLLDGGIGGNLSLYGVKFFSKPLVR